MNNNSLFEILAILIGFAGIMLVLSLLVTALTQAIAHFLSIRANNLQAGLAELLATAQEEGVGASFARAEKDYKAQTMALEKDCEAKKMSVVEAKAKTKSLEEKGKATPKDISEADGKVAKAEAEYEEAKRAKEELQESLKQAQEKLQASMKQAEEELKESMKQAEEELQASNQADQKAISEDEIKKKAEKIEKDKQKKIIDKAETAAKDIAEDILDLNSLMKKGKIKCLPKFMAPKASWVLKEELEILLREQSIRHTELTTEVIEKTMSWFSRMEKGLSQRFNIIMRCITLACALLVAVVFQVSAPDILERLSRDPQYRAKAGLEAAKLVGKYETDYEELTKYEDVSAMALEELQKNNPDLQETIEEASGIGNTKEEVLKELSVVLTDHPQQKKLVLEYEAILNNLHREGYEKASEMIEESVGTLALFDIAAFSHGAGFYWSIQNLFGILMTTILISLGAPFWFNTLRKLVALRDLLAPEENKNGKDTKPQDQ